jgi:CRISPR-associated protein Cas5d
MTYLLPEGRNEALEDGRFTLEVWGDLACFTRPEAKVERLSYPFMTPSAARGILDAIYCKPVEFGWRVDQIEILAPIRYVSLRRNEVKEKINEGQVRRAIAIGKPVHRIVADATPESAGSDQVGRTQRQTMALSKPHYRITCHIKPHGRETRLRALSEQMDRRIRTGKCFAQPYFGCREFAAFFAYQAPGERKTPIALDMEVNHMLYDVFDLSRTNVSGAAQPSISLFRAVVRSGVYNIPAYESDAVLKPA